MARQRIVARDSSPVGIVLLGVGLLLLALGCAGLLALIDDSFAHSIANNSTCNYHACSTSDIKLVGAIFGVVLGGLGLVLTLAGLMPWLRRRRSRRAGAAVETTGIAGLPGGYTAWTPPTPVTATTSAPGPMAGDDVAVRLQQLDQLQATGAITDAEYDRKRAEILAGI